MEIMDALKEAQQSKEITDFVNAYTQLMIQKQNPSRDGMIQALTDAQKVALPEIRSVEYSHGGTQMMPLSDFTNEALYAKLSEYQQGLFQYAIHQYGKEQVEKMLSVQQ